jgi:hypothetical protein
VTKRHVVAMSIAVLVCGVLAYLLWPAKPVDPRAAAFFRWNALAAKDDPRAATSMCRKSTPPASDPAGWPYTEEAMTKTLRIHYSSELDQNVTPVELRFDYLTEPDKPWSWSRPSTWFADDGSSWVDADWYVVLAFEDNQWKVCWLEVESRE